MERLTMFRDGKRPDYSTIDIILRAEYRTERRTIIVPKNVPKLKQLYKNIYVERSADRVYTNEEYESVGCTLVEPRYWATMDPATTLVLGLKELPLTVDPIRHTMVHFQHCYKDQEGSNETLTKFKEGGGLLYDLEYFNQTSGGRLFAFGEFAGFVGAALALIKWIQLHKPFDFCFTTYYGREELIELIKRELATIQVPKVMIIGANGRCGRGARTLLLHTNVKNITLWDITETKAAGNGPYKEILEHDIFINTIFLDKRAPVNNFVTLESLQHNVNLSIIVDVSCDVHSPNNVLPIYKGVTSFEEPFIEIYKDVHLCAIDNLPSLIAKDASDEFANVFKQLLLNDQMFTGWCWDECRDSFKKALTI